MIHKKYPIVTTLTVAAFTISGLTYIILGGPASDFILPNLSINMVRVLKDAFIKYYIFGALLLIAIAVGYLQRNSDGYTKLEI